MKLITLFILVFLSISCAQQLFIKPDGFDRYDVARVDVESNLQQSEEQVKQLATMIRSELNSQNIFRKVFYKKHDSMQDSLHINIVIMRINQTPDVQRLALGKTARSNEVTVQVILRDESSQKILSAFQLTAYSPERTGIRVEWPWGSVDKALQKISDQLVQQLAVWRNNSKD